MRVKKGTAVVIGGKDEQTKIRRTPSGVQEYQKTSLRISEGILTSYDLGKKVVKVVYTQFINSEAEYPFSYEPLNIGALGDESFMPPELLGPEHPGCVTDLKPDNMCTLNRTGEKYRLVLDPEFDSNGMFFLEPKNGPKKQFRSRKWTRRALMEHLDSLKGTVLTGRAIIDGIMLPDGTFENEIYLNPQDERASKKPVNSAVVFLLFKNGTHIGYPIMLIE